MSKNISESLEIIKALTEELAEWKELYAYLSERYDDIALLYGKKLKECHRYQDELRELKSSIVKPFDVKAEMSKIKKEISELETKKDE